ncbi:MAG: 30S ribosomal protein S6 [Candidatus Staskawiczbacteria bacterium]|nr:30S ribosomal protein S6 [Candidatus Staskawiczbacteria bacterium]
MKTYELTYIITPEITSKEAEDKSKELETLIQGKEGVIIKHASPTAKTLAYPIGKKASGFFGVLEFQAEPENILELKESISKDDKVVRQMITIKETIKIRKERRTKPAPVTSEQEQKTEEKEVEKPAPAKDTLEKDKEKSKVELKDIEQSLDEILGE